MNSGRRADYDEELAALPVRELARWLRCGIKDFFRLTPRPEALGPSDAFPMAKSYIGRNEFDLAADLKDLYDDLPAHAQGRFENAIEKIWSESDFDRRDQFVVGDTILTLACRIRAKGLIDVLPGAVFKLGVQLDLDFAPEVIRLQRAMFETAMELCSETLESARCLQTLLRAQRADPRSGYLPPGRSEDDFLYLARLVPTSLDVWFIIFAHPLRLDIEDKKIDPEICSNRFYDTLGRHEVDEVTQRIRQGWPALSTFALKAVASASLRETSEFLGVLFQGAQFVDELSDVEAVSLQEAWSAAMVV